MIDTSWRRRSWRIIEEPVGCSYRSELMKAFRGQRSRTTWSIIQSMLQLSHQLMHKLVRPLYNSFSYCPFTYGEMSERRGARGRILILPILPHLPSAFGVLVVTLLKMLTRTRKSVMRSAMRPGMTSGGTTKLIQDTTTNSPETHEEENGDVPLGPLRRRHYSSAVLLTLFQWSRIDRNIKND